MKFVNLNDDEILEIEGGGLITGAIGFVVGGEIGVLVGVGASAVTAGTGHKDDVDAIFVTCVAGGAAVGCSIGLVLGPA